MKVAKHKHTTYDFTFDSVEADMLYYIMNSFLGLDVGLDMYKDFAHSIIQEVENDED